MHGVFHKKLRKVRKSWEDGGVLEQRNRETAEEQARLAAQSAGDEYTGRCWLRGHAVPV